MKIRSSSGPVTYFLKTSSSYALDREQFSKQKNSVHNSSSAFGFYCRYNFSKKMALFLGIPSQDAYWAFIIL